MNQSEMRNKLNELLSMLSENEWVEFKEAKTSYDFDELGRYFSALSNEANLKEKQVAWFVLGVNHKLKKVVGTKFKSGYTALHALKSDIANHTNGRITFIEIHEHISKEGRVLLFEIPPCVRGMPTTWKDIAYGREGETIKPLSTYEADMIRNQSIRDWSGDACGETTVSDLDPRALDFLRRKLKDSNGDQRYLEMPVENLLNRLHLLNKGKLNNTAVLFLGQREVAEKHLPEISQVTWKYEDRKNNIVERIQFKAPLLPKLYDLELNIHRFNTYLRDFDLFRVDIKQYDDASVEELLVNSLVHRDWSIPLWVEVIQTPSSVTFRNPGIFRANLSEALKKNLRPPYTNQVMAEFFQKVGLMEKEGGGLQRVYKSQLSKGTRILPDFHTGTYPARVDFTLVGKVENVAFAKLVLSIDDDIELSDLLILDKIASGNNRFNQDIPSSDALRLRELNYIEIRGTRHRKCYISEALSHSLGRKGTYIREKGIAREQKITLILNYIDEIGPIKMNDVYSMFPEDSRSSLRHLVSREMCEKRKLLKRLMPSKNKSDWSYEKA